MFYNLHSHPRHHYYQEGNYSQEERERERMARIDYSLVREVRPTQSYEAHHCLTEQDQSFSLRGLRH